MTAEEKRQKILELKQKIEETKADYDRAKAMQLALKLVINGTYGAFAHPKFVLSNSHIANAITAQGRDVINFMLKKIENYFFLRDCINLMVSIFLASLRRAFPSSTLR